MSALRGAACDLLYREALFLDTQRWDEWLDLYTSDCEYWVPAWKSAHQVTEDPKREISLIYYASRAGLEDRVWRVRSGRSVAAVKKQLWSLRCAGALRAQRVPIGGKRGAVADCPSQVDPAQRPDAGDARLLQSVATVVGLGGPDCACACLAAPGPLRVPCDAVKS